MSSSEEWAWARRERRRAIYLERITSTTRSFLARYQQVIADMRAEGLERFVMEGFNQAVSWLNEAESSLDSDAERAQELSRSVGSILHGLPRFARNLREQEERKARNDEMARHAAQERARVIKERAKSEFVSRLQDIAGEIIDDPVAHDLVHDQLQRVIESASRTAADPSVSVESLESEFRSQCLALNARGKAEAEIWRKEHRRVTVQDSVVEEVDLQVRAIEEERKNKSAVAAQELQSMTERLMSLKQQFQSGAVRAELVCQELESARAKVDEVHCSEELRRDTLRALNRQMKELGFFGQAPMLQDQWVRLSFSRPDGASALFLVDTAGVMKFKFDGYRGKACRKDRDAILEKMRSAYGMEFSRQRVIWENPDEIGKDAFDRKTPNSTKGGR